MDYTKGNPFAVDAAADVEAPADPPGATEDTIAEFVPADERVINDLDADTIAALFDREADADTVDAAVDQIVAGLTRLADATVDGELLTVAVKAKKLRDAFTDTYNRARHNLWVAYGEGSHATEDGQTFRFAPPSGRRKTDLKKLQDNYPDVYADVVEVTKPKADTDGTLYITKPKKGAN